MKLSIIARSKTWHIDQLIDEGKKMGVEVEVFNIKMLNGWNKTIDKLGEVVLWRSSSLDIPLSRSIMMQQIDKKKYLFNRSLGLNPLLAHKLYQQKAINPLRTITGIPTYSFRSKKSLLLTIKEDHLRFPFVMKKNLSAQGRGVYLIKDEEDLSLVPDRPKDFVFQNFVKNDGDIRVLVLGGMALGAIKRIKGGDNFRNNVSLGGTAIDAKDVPEIDDLKNKALSIASKFELQFCGVDFIYDEVEKIWRFMEVNTVPQWQGFQQATGINVAHEIINYAVAVGWRKNKPISQLVSEYYWDNLSSLQRSDRHHFLSRLWLVNKDVKAKAELEKLESWYVGKDNLEERIKELTTVKNNSDEVVSDRQKGYRKYPRLYKWNNLLFWWLMCKETYRVDVSNILDKYFGNGDLIQLRKELENDPETVRVLSSASMNFCFLSEIYTGEKADTEYFYQIFKKRKETKTRDAVRNDFYYLSHLVIAGSYFYTRKLGENIYIEIIKEMEKLIRKNYFKSSLDMKFEFLVCCKLLNYQADLREVIISEADRSLSAVGNFLVDTHNSHVHGFGHKFGRGEHRNVLYLLAVDNHNL